MSPQKEKRVGLVLGGGGARGFAHVGGGVLARIRALFRRDLKMPLRLTYESDAIARAALVERHYRDHPPDLVIRPPLGHDVKAYSFDRWKKSVEIGYREAARSLADTRVRTITMEERDAWASSTR